MIRVHNLYKVVIVQQPSEKEQRGKEKAPDDKGPKNPPELKRGKCLEFYNSLAELKQRCRENSIEVPTLI